MIKLARGENIYKRKDGRWEGRYPKGRKQDGSIHYGYIYARSYRSVKEQLIEKKANTAMVYLGESKEFSGTFGDWANIWLNNIMSIKLKESTYASYSNNLQIHIFPFLEQRPLKKITPTEMDQLVRKLSNSLAPSSVHIVFRIVKSCLEAARERGYIYLNPCERTSLPKNDKKNIQALSRTQQKAVEKECLKTKKGLPILLALETGMRIGEICALKWEDIDFEDSVLHVHRTKQRIAMPKSASQRTKIIETAPKTTNANRLIPLSTKLKAALLNEQAQSISDFVVTTGHRSIEPRTVSYRFEQIKKKLGLINVPFHALRHTFATRCVELGVNIAAISSLLGHASIKLTLDTYTNSFFEEKRAAIAKLAVL
ncbi:tyrosine-type recombinase/integrase [Enterococcus termitis]|uniref:Tyr recombinase domain-containing protein n=1 Tax=Enterococcus termitis TaxID=332950 RepID=A0A1E5GVP5_9ENTE|nr:site-specific integrase [Enterococcus termitis]OEG16705.1 hypothetical protein BCR25_03660 [Enterococcus termitis]OJG99402.1 hypothetical protein RV18_GL001470 [Enterococcus termitis]